MNATKATKKIRIYRLAPRTSVPAKLVIPHGLLAMQAAVGGNLEPAPAELEQHNVGVLVDEEGGPDLKALPVTLRTPDGLVLRGPVVFVGLVSDGSWGSLGTAQQVQIEAWLKRCWLHGRR